MSILNLKDIRGKERDYLPRLLTAAVLKTTAIVLILFVLRIINKKRDNFTILSFHLVL